MSRLNRTAISRHTGRRITFSALAFALANVVLCSPVCAQGLRGVMDDLVRGTARVADDVPVKKVDEFVAELGKSRAAREAVNTELRKAGRLAENGDAVLGAARSGEVIRLLRTATADLDPSASLQVILLKWAQVAAKSGLACEGSV